MRKIRNSLNYSVSDQDREINDLPSLAVPDQALTVQQLLKKNQMGITTYNGQVPMYALGDDEFDELPDVKRLDLTELDELKQQNDAYIKEYRDNVQKQRAADNKKKLDEEFERRYQERKKAESAVHPADGKTTA